MTGRTQGSNLQRRRSIPARQSLIGVLTISILQWSCERPLLAPTSSSRLSAVAVACAPRAGTPSTHAYCSAWSCFVDRSTQFVTPTAEWGSSNEAIATVVGGVVEFHATGEVVITATYRWQDSMPVTGAHRLTVTERGCTVSDPFSSRLCDGASGGIPGVRTPGTCPEEHTAEPLKFEGPSSVSSTDRDFGEVLSLPRTRP